ncbi:MAG: cell wall-binding repeat-containing protein [Clostridiales bacterium]|nr:cell wall-binding repeat-containing protein [Clostridiales bacterium]
MLNHVMDASARVLLAWALALSMFPLATPMEAHAVTASTVRITSASLNAVTYATSQLVVAVGSSGTVVRSTEGGKPGTWVRAAVMPGGTHELTGVSFIDANRGWTISRAGVLFHTADGGKTWAPAYPHGSTGTAQSIFPSQGPGAVFDLAVISESLSGGEGMTGLAAGRQGTSSSAATLMFRRFPPVLYGEWATLFQAREYLDPITHNEPVFLGMGEFYSVDVRIGAAGPERAWVAGHDRYQANRDAPVANNGFVWTRAYDPVTRLFGQWQSQDKTAFANAGPLLGIAFGTSSAGVVVGAGGRAWRTVNGGDAWTATATGVTVDLRSVAMSDGNRAWAVGPSGRIISTTNGGASWSAQAVSSFDLRGIAARPGTSEAVAVGGVGVILYSSDGATWERADFAAPPPVVTGLVSSSHPDPSAWKSQTAVSLVWDAGNPEYIVGYSYVLDASPAAVPPTTLMCGVSSPSAGVTAQASGEWYVRVRALDVWGQWGPPSDPLPVRVDTAPPVFSHDINASGYIYEGQPVAVNLSVSDAHSGVTGFEYRIGGGVWTPVMGTSSTLYFDAIGTYELAYRATDRAGNERSGSMEVVLRSPGAPAPPEITALSSTSHPVSTAWYGNDSIALGWEASGTGIRGYWYSLDPAAALEVMTTETSATLSGVPSGTHTVYVRARDADVWSAAATVQVRVDVTAPVVTATVVSQQPLAGTVRIAAADSHAGHVAHLAYRLDPSAPWVPVAGASADIVISRSGVHTIHFWATDSLGNSSQGTREVRLDLPPAFTEVAGANRYATAARATAIAFPASPMPRGPDGRRTVVLASGESFPDALSASGLAGVRGAALLLTRRAFLSAEARDQIVRLGADRVVIVGGSAAVDSAVSRTLAQMGLDVQRFQGTHRYETAREIAARIVAENTGWDGTAFVATGRTFPDSLAAAPIAAAKGWPLYLFDTSDAVNAATIAAMKGHGVKRVIVLGGEGAVSALSYDSLAAAFGAIKVERRYGADRYSTAVDIAQFAETVGLDWTRVALATGQNFPDALAGGVMQAQAGSVMLLTHSASLTSVTGDALAANRNAIDEVRFLGGTSVLTQQTRDQVRAQVE